MSVWQAGLIGAWAVMGVQLALTLRILRWHHANDDRRNRIVELDTAPGLTVGDPAPPFRARTLAGDWVTLDDYAGRTIAFVFVSPECPSCRRELRGLVRLARLARERADVEIVLVSNYGAGATERWLNEVRRDDGVQVELPMLVAPIADSDLVASYNPRALTPYYCLIGSDGTVLSRDPVGTGDWLRLRATWEGSQNAARRALR